MLSEEKKYINYFQENNLLLDFTAIENVIMPQIIKELAYLLQQKRQKKF